MTTKPWIWPRDAFEKLKLAITLTPILPQSDVEAARSGEGQFIIYTNVSKTGFYAVPRQGGQNMNMNIY